MTKRDELRKSLEKNTKQYEELPLWLRKSISADRIFDTSTVVKASYMAKSVDATNAAGGLPLDQQRMNNYNKYCNLQSEITTLKSILVEIPINNVVEILSLKSRLEEVEKTLDTLGDILWKKSH